MKIILYKFILLSIVFTWGCNTTNSPMEETTKIKDGKWKAILNIQDKSLPFIFIKKGNEIVIHNGEEQLVLDSIIYFSDSVSIPMHIFDARIVAKIKENQLEGYWTKDYILDYKIPFHASLNPSFRFMSGSNFSESITGKWRVKFMNEEDTTPAIAIFNDKADQLTGTFLTPTGDYRFLEGIHVNDSIMLSTFDGSHAYLFGAKVKNDTLTGLFWSGKNWKESWIAVRDNNYELPNPETLTFLKNKKETLTFSFPLPNGKMIGPNDERFKDKILIIQLLGSWCPNCMDESKFLVNWLENNRDKDVAVLGLAYEAKKDFTYAVDRITKMKQRLGIDYPIAIAGTKDKEEASKTLPMLNGISSFPTTIILDKNKKIRKIHTGFSGPGTGKYYEKFVEDFQNFISSLLLEAKNS